MTGAEIASRVTDRSSRGIAVAIGRLISSGELAPGNRLPTVRQLARALGVSPTTVASAWRTLTATGVIETRRKLGTRVRAAPLPAGPTRFARLHVDSPRVTLDLSAGTPDPALLPDLRRALSRLSPSAGAHSYFDPPILAGLEDVLRADWPFAPERMTVVDGALDAMDRLFQVCLRVGDRVFVENPTFPPILDLLEQSGADIVGLPIDDSGIEPAALGRALSDDAPAAVVLQPRSQNPCGSGLTERRGRDLAELLRPASAVLIEDDHAAYISRTPPVSLGSWLPQQTVLVRSFSKSHGPDLRLAAVGGAAEIIERMERRRILGPAWSSRLLQSLLLHLLTDPGARRAVAHAGDTYAERRVALLGALRQRGVAVVGADGINLWIDADDERSALVRCAMDGITVAPGSPFLSGRLPGDHVRLTCATVSGGVDELADVVAAATRAGTSQRVV